jgi:hypothetical protein
MIRITEKGFFSTAIFLFAAVICYATASLRSDVGLVPRIVGILLLILSGLQMLMDLFPFVKKHMAFLEMNSTASLGGEGQVQEQDEPGDTLQARTLFFGWIAMFIALIYLTSMMLATAISLFLYLKYINRETWRVSILYSLSMAVFIYLVFVLGFKLHYFI